MQRMCPVADRIIVIEDKPEEVTAGGIHLPTGSRIEETSSGVVAEVGEGRRDINGQLIPLTVKPGDVVIFPRGAGTPVKGANFEFTIMTEEDLYVILYDDGKDEPVAEDKNAA